MDQETTNLLTELMADFSTVSYSGAFDGAVLAAFAKRVETTLSDNPKLNKKIFKIFVELAQNIALYSSDKVVTEDQTNFNGYGIFIIKEYFDKFRLFAGNMAFKEDANIASEKCEKINSLSREELRQFKRDLRKQPSSQKGGGNIGLVQVVLTANNYIDHLLIEVDPSHSFLIFSVDISKLDDSELN
ncbi:MAG: SiaB family protein kinase [Bacteroidales bacterium]|nr:SiaB family protein kinase [Bacteroidales bacterium]